jgi:hypothetical protein
MESNIIRKDRFQKDQELIWKSTKALSHDKAMIFGFIPTFLHRFIMNESALCYQQIYVCLYVMKCIVMTLQLLQTSPLAQIYLLTKEINLPSDVEKSTILAAASHLEFLKTNIWKCYNLWTVLRYRLQTGVILPRIEFSWIFSIEFWLHLSLATPHFPIHKMVGGQNAINVITSESFDRFKPNWRHFVQSAIAINSGYIMIVIKVKMAASRHLDFARISL